MPARICQTYCYFSLETGICGYDNSQVPIGRPRSSGFSESQIVELLEAAGQLKLPKGFRTETVPVFSDSPGAPPLLQPAIIRTGPYREGMPE